MSIDLMKNKTHCPNCDHVNDNESGTCNACGFDPEDIELPEDIVDYWTEEDLERASQTLKR